ncbi:MAG TPA: cytochrome c [Sandaracinaceae bacterium]
MRHAAVRACFLVAALALAGCGNESSPREWRPSDHQEPSSAPDSSQAAPVEEPPQAAVARAAAALYRVSCASCHGISGRGDGPAAPPGVQMPDLTSAALHDARSDEDLARVIREGRGTMPGFGSQINDRGIAALVAHVRTLRAQ